MFFSVLTRITDCRLPIDWMINIAIRLLVGIVQKLTQHKKKRKVILVEERIDFEQTEAIFLQ